MKLIKKSAFSIVIAIWLALIMSLLVLYILEYIIPYSKNVKGIENSSNAFYQAESSIQEGLFFFKNRLNIDSETNKDFGLGQRLDYKYLTVSSGSIIPPVGEGNSDFDKNYNILSAGKPIQIEIGGEKITSWSSVDFSFQVPEIDGNTYTLSGGTQPIINWQISGFLDTLNASGSWILGSDIPLSSHMFNGIKYNNEGVKFAQGKNLAGSGGIDQKISNISSGFYQSNCRLTASGCILKMSIINELVSTTGIPIPYLEYKIDFGLQRVPLQYSTIKSAGKSYGFQKKLNAKMPQKTTNEAFDFTVFQ